MISCLDEFKKCNGKILIYGLSGDPPTNAHKKIITCLLENGITFDKVFILPTFKYALKNKPGQDDTYPFRLKLIRKTFGKLNITPTKKKNETKK